MKAMELWHALNRGVDGREIFHDSQDYARFVHNLYEFNDTLPADNLARRFDHSGMKGFVNPSFERDREKLVDIHGWCLMKNHYHLLLSERRAGGLSLFLRKLNVGYANYFNERHERSGTLFQGRTKKIMLKTHSHVLYVLHYIHLNPLDYLEGASNWRLRSKRGIENMDRALVYLQNYRWSSYLDYMETKNFPSILTVSFFNDVLGNYGGSLKEYLLDTERDGLEASGLE